MKVLQRLFLISPTFFIMFIACWWSGVAVFNSGGILENQIKYFVYSGVAAGFCFAALIYLIAKQSFLFSKLWIYLFACIYHLLFIGFFMGVPLFNILIAPAYLLILKNIMTSEIFTHFRFTSRICLFFVCILSAFIAIQDPFTLNNITGMTGITLSQNQLYLLIFFGGIALILFQELFFHYYKKRVKIQ